MGITDALRAWGAPLLVVAATQSACTIALPQQIVRSQLAAFDTHGLEVSAPTLVPDAHECAARLNEHRADARTFNAVRVTTTAIGGLAAGVGGVLSVAIPESQTTGSDAGKALAISGGVLALVGTFITSLIGEPSDRLQRHERARQSWERANSLVAQARRAEVPASERQRLIDGATRALHECHQDRAPAPEMSFPVVINATPIGRR